MSKLNRKQSAVLNKIRKTGGRFFGLYTTQGETINAQFRGETEKYITVFDRNKANNRRFAKTSLDKITIS